ncbi:MAG: M23 family metallopeptidase [Desulfobacterales bacterium]|jgi:murein DD-endopeptidase MepM/ murein hydrolase activator NlpD|nr:M23 family metallopeptidase [Desulfobacterales bacterium]
MVFKTPASGFKVRAWLLTACVLIIILPVVWYLSIKLEGEKPVIEMDEIRGALPSKSELSGTVVDMKSGVKKILIQLIKDNKEIILMDQAFEPSHWMRQPSNHRIPFTIPLDAKKMDISDGKAVLVFSVWDHSWRTWWNGNRIHLEKEISFDTRTPVISVLSGQHYINQGGAGLVIYRISEPCVRSGVFVGDEFFPGHSGCFEDNDVYLAFFSVKPDQDPGTNLYVSAVDDAGNASKSSFYYRILTKSFKQETLALSDAFLNSKFSEFESMDGWPADGSTVDKFLFINQQLRVQNNEMILNNGRQTDSKIHWEGAFLRMPNSAPMASYADHRLYSYNGNIIGEAEHLGVDLASLSNASVPAANSGKVAFSGYIGIYGNTVCIDHGFGVFTLYSHLSQMDVGSGDMVVKGEVIGRTGTTGWAGGDHLHYGMFVDHIFVNPAEWWDPSWIKNNITDKIQSAGKVKN